MLAIVLAACGGTPAVRRPDTAKLARLLHEDLVQLARIAKAHRGNCRALVGALRPHVDRMRAHADEVKRVQQNTEHAKQLRKDVAAYDVENRGLADTIGGDLGASYRTCPEDRPLLEQIDRIPEL
ncbi:MAG TPA: hypothetical protein VK427_09340 [Kofleriaceae bacterium]|nr:hypothetical protein [Kofleriaceae bacterium]